MIPAYNWHDRKFSFEHLDPMLFPDVVERLRGTPARAAALVEGLDAATLTRRDGDEWSIQENIGHLFDVETLWAARIRQLLSGETTLRAWDETNRVTYDADYNASKMSVILTIFRKERDAIAARLGTLGPQDVVRSALHVGLGQQVRLIDMAYFACEHDDHHLAQVTRLKRAFA